MNILQYESLLIVQKIPSSDQRAMHRITRFLQCPQFRHLRQKVRFARWAVVSNRLPAEVTLISAAWELKWSPKTSAPRITAIPANPAPRTRRFLCMRKPARNEGSPAPTTRHANTRCTSSSPGTKWANVGENARISGMATQCTRHSPETQAPKASISKKENLLNARIFSPKIKRWMN